MTPESEERKTTSASNGMAIPVVHYSQTSEPSRFSALSWLFAPILALILIATGVRSILGNLTNYGGYIWIAAGAAITAIWSFFKKPLHRFPAVVWNSRTDALSLLFCCALSFTLRAYQLHERPWGLHNDIGWGACVACSALEGGTIPFQSGGYLYGSAYSMVPAFYVLGPSVFSLRLTFAVLGVLGTLGIYCLTRLTLGSPLALVAGLLSAVSPFEIGFERNADMPALLITYGAPMLAFLWWSLSRLSWVAPILAGIFLAFFTVSYLAAKGIGPVFFLATAAYALIRAPLPRRRLFAQLLLAAAAYFIIAFRFFHEAVRNPAQFFLGELNSNIFATAASTDPLDHLARNVHAAYTGLLGRGEIIGASYPGPVLEPILLILLIFGTATLIGRCWDLLPYFCLAAAAIAFIPALLGPTFEPRRAIFIAPMLTILPVAGLAALARAIREGLRGKAGTVVSLSLAACVSLAAVSGAARKYARYQLPFWGEGVPNRVFGEFLVSLNDKYFVFIDDGVGIVDTAYFLLYAHYREDEYVLTKYNSDPAVRPRPGHYRLHNFERDGLPVPPLHDRPVMYVVFRWDQQYDRLVPLIRSSLAHVKYQFEAHQLPVPGSTFRYVLMTFTIPVESIDLIKASQQVTAVSRMTRTPAAAIPGTSYTAPTDMSVAMGAAIRAAREGSLDTLQRLIAENPSLAKSADGNGWTLLHIAAGEGREDVVRFLLRSGAAVDPTDQVNSTPLQKAIYFNHPEAVRVLLEHGADPAHKDRFGSSAMDYAGGRSRIIEILQSKPKPPGSGR
jgi:hypothetical protein